MQLAIQDVLSPADLAEIAAAWAAVRFVDGAATAGWNARTVKHNEQAAAGDPAAASILGRVRERMQAHPLVTLAARPRHWSPLLLSRYGVGMAYGSHVDNAVMGEIRTDIAFTMFLEPPERFGGGELVIESTAGEQAIKLPAGAVFLYPADTLHRVAPVTAGERRVVVGWVQSRIRNPQQRELLFDLDTARRQMFEAHGKTAAFDLVSKSATNLLRQWAES